MTVMYHHMTDNGQQELVRVTKTAGKLFKQIFTLPSIHIGHWIHNDALRLANIVADDALITFDTLPSGRYRAVKHRTALRKNCMRAKAISCLNR